VGWAAASAALDAGFLDPALADAACEGGLADALEGGLEAALDCGFDAAALEAGFALDAGLAFLDGGFSMFSSSVPLGSTSFSAVVRFLPRDLGFSAGASVSSPRCSSLSDAGFAFLALGLAGAFFLG